MKLENQVCSLEQANTLKQLGIEYKSLFNWWFNEIPTREGFDNYKHVHYYAETPTSDKTVIIPAFTVAELGVMLPDYVETHRSDKVPCWYCGFLEQPDQWTTGGTQAEAMAKFLINSLETEIATPDEVNQRLIA